MRALHFYPDSVIRIRYCAHLAEAYGHVGRTEEALTTARHAIDLGRRSELPPQEAWSHYTLGRILARQGQAEAHDAREEVEASLRLTRELGLRPLEAQCLLELASLPAEELREHLATATRMFAKMGMEFWRETAEQALAQLPAALARRLIHGLPPSTPADRPRPLFPPPQSIQHPALS